MSTATAITRLDSVTRLNRRGIGPIYRAQLSLGNLYELISRGAVRYAPKYQRGYKDWDQKEEADLYKLRDIHDRELQLNEDRAMEMAVKYLLGELYTSYITWNARKEERYPDPKFEENNGTGTLVIETTITVPDTGHRHLAYYLLGYWKDNPSEVPSQVMVNRKPVDRETILEKLDDLDLENEYVYVDVYTLDPVKEGYLYDEFNADAKPPHRAVAIDLNPQKTPARRFVYGLIDGCKIFSRKEVETRGNTIGSKSRKLTTNSTLEGAVRPFEKRLAEFEGTPAYDDLLDFTCAYYEEWAKIYKEFLPNAGKDARHDLRKKSFALSNIMFHPMFRLIFGLWDEYHDNGKDWHGDKKWKDVVAKIGGEVTTTDPDDPKKKITVKVMARDFEDSDGNKSKGNPEWRGKILIKKLNQDDSVSWSLSSTRQTRDSAYNYLRQVAELNK